MPEPEVDDGVHVRVPGDQAHDLGDGVAGLAAGAVDRVGPAPPGRQLPVDGGPQVVGQRQQAQVAVAGDGVGRDHAPPPGGGQHDDVGTGRQGLRGEGRGGLERLLDRRRPRGAGLAADAVEHPVVAGERAGVARRRPLAALGARHP